MSTNTLRAAHAGPASARTASAAAVDAPAVSTPPAARAAPASALGAFLRDRRARVRPAANGSRRRTPGLRREEVATRAGVSVTWYTWLEQGRGGPPSDDLLERLARALELDADARELMFLLAHDRPPPVRTGTTLAVPPAVQHVLDAMPLCPAYVKTPSWDIVAWNRAATLVFVDYGAVAFEQRNPIRRLFSDPAMRRRLPDWTSNARFALAAFRIDLARAGSSPAPRALLDEMLATSDDFAEMWNENEVRTHGVGHKRIQHPKAGPITLDYSTFDVDGAPGLSMVVFTPADDATRKALATLLA